MLSSSLVCIIHPSISNFYSPFHSDAIYIRILTAFFDIHFEQKSSFNTYTSPMAPIAPYVSIVPTSSAAAAGLLIRAPQPVAIGPPPSSILIGSSGLNNNPSILAQSPSNLGNAHGNIFILLLVLAMGT